MSVFFNFPPALLVFLLAMALVVLLTDVLTRKDPDSQIRGQARVCTLSLIALIILLVWIVILYPTARHRFFDGRLIWDPLSALLGLAIVALSALAFLYARDDLKLRQISPNDYYILGLFSVLGMLVLVSAGSMLSLYLGLELMSLPLYAMVALDRQQAVRAEAAMKYIIMGAVASACLLYGFSLIYSMDHSLMLTSLFRSNMGGTTPLLMQIGIVLVAVAIAFKIGAAPFHFWVPDVYQGAPVAVGLFVGTAPKVAVVGMALRLMLDSFPALLTDWGHLFLIIALLSVVLGNLVALMQTRIRRLLAYASIAHMGYVLLGLSAKITGCGMAIFYSLSYGLMTASAFGVLAVLNRAGTDIEHLSDLKGLSTRSPGLAFMMMLTMFSMAGIPPFIGFFVKLGILQALLATGQTLVACVALFFAVIGAYYYLNVIKVMYFEAVPIYAVDPMQSGAQIQIGGKAYGMVSVNALLLLGLGLLPDALLVLCHQAVAVIPAVLVGVSA